MVTATDFPDALHFKHRWRDYQKQVLNQLEDLRDDEHIHIVAAPGSGKTVLGLEVIRRLGRPALVLAPTVAIRDQWIERLVRDFLPEGADVPGWISTDIRRPGKITVATYQALHSAMKGEPDPDDQWVSEEETHSAEIAQQHQTVNVFGQEDGDEDIEQRLGRRRTHRRDSNLPDILRAHSIDTLVLDEAHHLRTEWWGSLTRLVHRLSVSVVVALTATPPYDVPEYEWDRYVDLCGPIDIEVPVPELVAVGDVCPHQDLIYLTTPTEDERRVISEYRQRVELFVEELKQNAEFIALLSNHPWVQDPESYAEEVLEEPDLFSSMLVFLGAAGVEVPKKTVKFVAGEVRRLPSLNLEWLEILLTGLLFPHGSRGDTLQPILERVLQELRDIGAVERRHVMLRETKTVKRLLMQSISKLEGMKEIVVTEYESLISDMRMVILTDYIRKGFIPRNRDDERPLLKIGVVPIFETLRRARILGLRLGVLTGSLVIIPSESEERFLSIVRGREIDPFALKLRPYPADDDYLLVEVSGSQRSVIVGAVTELFNQGGLHVLVGTTALLGEGWDAPTVNSLILASFVGSYMLSNQMRGRAIRSVRDDPDKTANIWHLACVYPDSHDAGGDYETLVRRFRAFLGISFEYDMIENGIARTGIGEPPFSKKSIDAFNKRMLEIAEDRQAIRERWEVALRRGEEGVRLVEEVKAPPVLLPRGFVFRNTISAMFWEGVALSLYVFAQMARAARNLSSLQELLIFMEFAAIIAVLVGLPKMLKAVWLAIRHGPVKSSLREIGLALVEALYYAGAIRTSPDYIEVIAEDDPQFPGWVFCQIKGGTNRDRWTYQRALQELLNPIRNPRYLLVRYSSLWNLFGRVDYHAVPAVLGTNRRYASNFAERWERHVGKMALVYTRNAEGRRILLQARTHSLSAAFRPRAESITRWR